MNRTVNISGINIFRGGTDEILKYLENRISCGRGTTVCHVNAHILVLAEKDKNFSGILKSFDLILPDGAGVYLASKFLYGFSGIEERITGTDLYPQILRLAANHGKSFFYAGSNERMHRKLSEKISSEYPQLGMKGFVSGETFMQEMSADGISSAGPDVIFIGTGSPYQEKYIIQYRSSAPHSIFVASGSGLEFLCGYKKRAPAAMRNLGIEWLYRLFQEPARLWKRYILGIPLFMFYVVRFKFKFHKNA